MQEYNFDIVYWPGKEKIIANSLSRKSYLEPISMPDNPILLKIRESTLGDPEYQKMLNLTQIGGRINDERSLFSNYVYIL